LKGKDDRLLVLEGINFYTKILVEIVSVILNPPVMASSESFQFQPNNVKHLHQPTDISTTFVNSTAAISALVDTLTNLPTNPPSIYVDLEGIELSRTGSISLISILVQPTLSRRHAYLVDIYTMGSIAFTTTGLLKKTLKAILESPDISKVFFDVRNDSDALYAHFAISLQGIIDVQLMELASRGPFASRKCVNGLGRCIDYDLPLSSSATAA
jgi:exonuclease 3'-5' domain-containing protein 1